MKGPIKKLLIINILAFTSLLFTSQAVFGDSDLSISISSDSVRLELLPGEFGTKSQTITASTTDSSGYTIRLTTASDSAALVDVLDNSKTIPTFTLPSGSSSIPVDSIGDGYGYSVDSGANYSPIPEPLDAPAVLFKTSTAGSNNHTLTFGVKAPTSIQSGTYSNTFNTQLIDSYLKNNSTLKEKYCWSYQQLKRLYERLFREFSNISLLNDNLKHFFYTADKIIEYISIENLLSEQFILKELNRELYDYYQRI